MFHHEIREYADREWQKATCGECAWKIGEWRGGPESKPHGVCRRSAFGGEIDLGWVNHDDTACPAFVRRPEVGGA